MMTFSKARKSQSVIIFSVVILIGAGVSIFSKIPRRGDVEGVEDDRSSGNTIMEYNEIPVFKSEPPINGYVGEIYSYYVSVSDSDSSDLELILVKGPLWLNVNNLEVYGVPFEETSPNGEKVVLEISDGVNSSYQTFYLNVVTRDED